MTMAAKPIAYYLAPALLVLDILLAVGHWVLQPERAVAWAATVALVCCMTVAFLFAARHYENDAGSRRAGDSIWNAIVFAGLIIALSLGAKLATALGAIDDADFSRRATMAIMGVYFVFTGNAVPKTLTPLSAQRCDAVKVQSFQRFAGWTWVLTGVAFTIVWLALPVALAQPVSIVLLLSGMLMIVSQMLRLRRTRQRPA